MEKIKQLMVEIAVRRPRTLILAMVLATLAAAAFLPGVVMDTDPENMLDPAKPVRVFHNQSKKTFSLSDTVVVGIFRDDHPEGVFNPGTLGRIHELTRFAKTLKWPVPAASGDQAKGPDQPAQWQGVVEHDIWAPSVMDHMRQAGPGILAFERLMPEPPADPAQALAVRDRILSNPMLKGRMISDDHKALCLYLPLNDKMISYQVFTRLKEKIAEMDGPETFHITGLPVAEGAVGVEMFTEMRLASPLAMGLVFLLLFFFFRKWVLILVPMVIATVSIIMAMGLMIGLGFEVHILSSMLPIFLMSISIVDSVHVLSEFFDRYTPEKGKAQTIREVMHTLFVPMLYTSLTTAAGFLSLTLTSLPPARVFGLFLSIGVMLAWLCTILFIPAYIILIPERMLAGFGLTAGRNGKNSRLASGLAALGRLTATRAKPIMFLVLAALVLAGFGISQTRINDNYSKRFVPGHPVRDADTLLNQRFGGTYTAYLVLSRNQHQAVTPDQITAFEERMARSIRGVANTFPAMASLWDKLAAQLPELAAGSRTWPDLLDQVITRIEDAAMDAPDSVYDAWQTLGDLIRSEQETLAPFKQPRVLAYMADLQAHLTSRGLAGTTLSAADVVCKVNQELTDSTEKNYRIPQTVRQVGECFMQFQQSHRPQDLWHMVTPDYTQAAIMVQMPSGNSMDMETVVQEVRDYMAASPPPAGLTANWSGLHYVNLVFQNTMFWEMLISFFQSFAVVFVMMAFLFRSLKWGLLCMVPLSITIAAIYGVVGLIGKDYDMPVAVLSVLSIGIAVDFAIHFLERCRRIYKIQGSWEKTLPKMFGEPARAITRNVLVIAVGFLPLVAARLVPYQITGLMLFAILVFSGLVTLVVLPALLTLMEHRFFSSPVPGTESMETAAEPYSE